MKHIQQSILDTPVEPDEATLEEILWSISHLSDEDCERIVSLQKYHEMMYQLGTGIPRYQFVRGKLPDMNA